MMSAGKKRFIMIKNKQTSILPFKYRMDKHWLMKTWHNLLCGSMEGNELKVVARIVG
jgi:GTP-dependent phosphoenolpyruvate carboxykinase